MCKYKHATCENWSNAIPRRYDSSDKPANVACCVCTAAAGGSCKANHTRHMTRIASHLGKRSIVGRGNYLSVISRYFCIFRNNWYCWPSKINYFYLLYCNNFLSNFYLVTPAGDICWILKRHDLDDLVSVRVIC